MRELNMAECQETAGGLSAGSLILNDGGLTAPGEVVVLTMILGTMVFFGTLLVAHCWMPDYI